MNSFLKNVPSYIQTLEPYPPGKPIEELKREYGIDDCIKLASNENPFGPSPRALEAIKGALNALNRYPDGSGYYLKERLKRLWGVKPENICLGNGSNEVIQFLVHAFAGPGTEVISSDPAFLVYRKMVQIFGAKNILIPLKQGRHDLDAMAESVTERTRIIFLDNPHNPTGSIIRKDEFEGFLARLPEHVIVCLDEAYGEFVRDETCVFGKDFLGHDPRVVFLRTFSKAYGLSGLRIGYGVMDEAILTTLEKVRQPFNVNSLAQIGALNALDDHEHLKKTLGKTWKGIDWLIEKLQEMGFVPLPTNTNFILVDVKRPGNEIYEEMLKMGVIIRAMTAYGFPTAIRITVGTMAENKRCVDALSEAAKRVSCV